MAELDTVTDLIIVHAVFPKAIGLEENRAYLLCNIAAKLLSRPAHPCVGKEGEMRLLLAAAIAILSSIAQAQQFPSRPVTLIVPFPAGGGTDTAMRALASATEKHLGQKIVIENKPG